MYITYIRIERLGQSHSGTVIIHVCVLLNTPWSH